MRERTCACQDDSDLWVSALLRPSHSRVLDLMKSRGLSNASISADNTGDSSADVD